MKKDSNATTGYILVLCAGILWGSIGFFVRKLNGLGVDTELTAFMRIFCAWIILIPLLIGMSLKSGRNYFKISKKGLLQCFIIGAPLYCADICEHPVEASVQGRDKRP